MNRKFLITSLLLLLSSLINAFLLFSNRELRKQTNLFYVEKVFDGDSFATEFNDVRLASIDAPQIEFCMGEKAKKRLEKMVLNRNVKLDKLKVDEYNRPLVFAYVDDLFVNEVLLKEGYARYKPLKSDKREILKQADAYAREKNLGLWNECRETKNIEEPECNIKGNIEIRSKEKRYFFPGCSNYNNVIIDKDLGEQWFCTEQEAQDAGFERSGDCP